LLIVFDLDGTLIDSRLDLAESANRLIIERGGAPLPVDRITAMVGEGAKLLVQRALTAAGLEPEVNTALPRFLDLYDERLLVHTAMYPGTQEMLEAVRPHARLAVLTNKPQHHTERILDGLSISRFFDRVVGGDSPFGRKPDPGGLRHLMSSAGSTTADTVLVGDSFIDLRTARAGAVRLCLVRYGFGFAGAERELLEGDLVADAPADVPKLIGLDF
jgi:phosphoglycolate phosphatase